MNHNFVRLGSTALPETELPLPVAATILLGGSVRATAFSAAIERPLLDLPCNQNFTLLGAWCNHLASLPASYRNARHTLRILTDHARVSSLSLATPVDGVEIRVDGDPTPWRGTGG